MNKFAKDYLKNVKSFFPITGPKERHFLKSLEITINDFCESNEVNSMEDIHKDFGLPHEVANTYFVTLEPEYLMRRISFGRQIRALLIVLVLIFFIGLVDYGLYLNHAYNLLQEQMIFFEETTIY